MNKILKLLLSLLIIFTTTYNSAISDLTIKKLNLNLISFLAEINPITKKMYINYGTIVTNDCGGEGQGQKIGCVATQYIKPIGIAILDLKNRKIITKRKLEIASRALAINPSNNRIYIDDGSKNLLVLNGNGKKVFTIPLHREIVNEHNSDIDDTPQFAINPDKNLIYLTNYYEKTISVINGATNEIVSDIKVNSFPLFLALNPNTNKLYVGYSSEITIIDTLSNTIIETINLDRDGIDNSISSVLYNLAIDTNLNKLYISTSGSPTSPGNLLLIDLSNKNLITEIEGLPHINNISINSNTNKIYATVYDTDKSLIVIDSKSNQEVKSFSKNELGEIGSVIIDPLSNLIYYLYLADDRKTTVVKVINEKN